MTRSVARILDEADDFGRGLSALELVAARRLAVAHRVRFARHAMVELGADGSTSYLVLSGFLLREMSSGARASGELAGEGDVIAAGTTQSWVAHSDVELAVLDTGFMRHIAAWPSISAELLVRSGERSDRLLKQMAIADIHDLEPRLLALLEELAERWGRVTPRGYVIDVRLSHKTLALLAGAVRPGVTRALGGLARSGRIERLPDGRFCLPRAVPVPLAVMIAALTVAEAIPVG